MADYCTLEDVWANPDFGFVGYNSILSSLITTASRMIDGALGKWDNYFYPSTDAETRYYTFGGDCLEIDEAVSITSVAVSEGGEITSTGYTTWAATDYMLKPDNYTALGEPIRWIEIDHLNGSKDSFYGYPKGVKVTGIFGYSVTPPSDVKRACIAQTISMFMQDKQGYQSTGAGGNAGSLNYETLHPLVTELLKRYKMKVIV